MSLGYKEIAEKLGAKEFPHSSVNPRDELRQVTERLAPRVVVEIGTYHGISTIVLASIAEFVHTFDLKPFNCQEIWEKFGLVGKIRYHVVPNRWVEAELISQTDFDLAYIDGVHTYSEVGKDFDMVKHRGRVLFHDAHQAPIRKFMDEIDAQVEGVFGLWEKH